MPIEIKELHIRVAIGSTAHAEGHAKPGHDEAKDELVARCVEQVLQILQNKAER